MPPSGGGSPTKDEGIRLDELEGNINGMRTAAERFAQGEGVLALASVALTHDAGLIALVAQWADASDPSCRSFVLAVLLHAELISWKPGASPSARSSALIADADAAIQALWTRAEKATQKAHDLPGAPSVT